MSEQAVPSLRERLAARNRPAWQQAVPQPVEAIIPLVEQEPVIVAVRPVRTKPAPRLSITPGMPHCADCGVPVPGKAYKVRYCKPCLAKRNKAHEAQRKEERRRNKAERACLQCMTMFVPELGWQRYCTLECRQEGNRKRTRKRYAERRGQLPEGMTSWIEAERAENAKRRIEQEDAA